MPLFNFTFHVSHERLNMDQSTAVFKVDLAADPNFLKVMLDLDIQMWDMLETAAG